MGTVSGQSWAGQAGQQVGRASQRPGSGKRTVRRETSVLNATPQIRANRRVYFVYETAAMMLVAIFILQTVLLVAEGQDQKSQNHETSTIVHMELIGLSGETTPLVDTSGETTPLVDTSGETTSLFDTTSLESTSSPSTVTEPDTTTEVTTLAPPGDESVANLTVSKATAETLTIQWDKTQTDDISHFLLEFQPASNKTCILVNLRVKEQSYTENLDTSCPVECDQCDWKNGTILAKDSKIYEYEQTGLQPCSIYTITVTALNNAGSGTPAEITSSTTRTAPRSQIVIQLPEVTAETITVSWEKSEDPAECDIDYYIVNVTYTNCSTKEAEFKEYNTTNTKFTMPDLNANTNYNVTVTAFIMHQEGKSRSNPSEVQTLGKEPSGKPQNVEVSNVTHAEATLTWEEPDQCEHNGELLYYVIKTSCKDKATKEDYETTTESNPTEFKETVSVTPYSACNFNIAAHNVNGSGPEASVKNDTKEWFPGQVLSVKYARNLSQMEVSWDAPEKPNGKIVQYSVGYQSENNITDVDKVSETQTTLEVNECYNYTLRVRASTSVGSGNWSDQTDARAEVSAPLAVTNVTVTEGKREVTVSWVKPLDRTGPTSYRVTVEPENKIIIVDGYDNQTAIVPDLHPNVEYNVTIKTVTCSWENVSQAITFETLPDVPGAVQSPNVIGDPTNCTQLNATWGRVLDKEENGDMKNYIIEVYTSDRKLYKTFRQEVNGKENYTKHLDVEAETDYTFEFFAANEVGQGEGSHVSLRNPGSCAPDLPKTEEEGPSEVVAKSSEPPQYPWYQIKIHVQDSFLETTQGTANEWGLIVTDTEYIDTGSMGGERFIQLEDFKLQYNRTWSKVKDEEAMKSYRVCFERKEMENPTIGKDSTGCPAFYNGKLKPGRIYRVKAYTCTAGGCAVTAYSQEVTTAAIGPNTSAILAGVLVPVILLLTGILIYMRRRSLRPWGTKRAKKSEGSVNGAFEARPSAVPLVYFREHVASRHRNSDLIFSEEFKLLKDVSPPMTWNSAELPQNRVKNRYTNILPFDHSRVKLLAIDDEDEAGSDFINANFVPGYNSKREFIGTQGPLPGTKDDFWRMIWEQHVGIIVMVTNCVEKGRHKCDQYWSTDNEPIFYGDLQVQVRSESVLDNYTIRIMDISMGETKRTIKQFNFTTWPDFGCPETTQALLNFVFAVRSHRSGQQKGPVLVHCSAGVGRTGTFICIDRLLQHMRDHDDVDVFGTILEMRGYRCNMVQTEDQYIYIHDCLDDALQQNLHMKYPRYNQQPPALTPLVTEGPGDDPIYENFALEDGQRVDAECGEITQTDGRIIDPIDGRIIDPIDGRIIDPIDGRIIDPIDGRIIDLSDETPQIYRTVTDDLSDPGVTQTNGFIPDTTLSNHL